jgi:carboxypeptidase C (cathepsin A)
VQVGVAREVQEHGVVHKGLGLGAYGSASHSSCVAASAAFAEYSRNPFGGCCPKVLNLHAVFSCYPRIGSSVDALTTALYVVNPSDTVSDETQESLPRACAESGGVPEVPRDEARSAG